MLGTIYQGTAAEMQHLLHYTVSHLVLVIFAQTVLLTQTALSVHYLT